MIETVDAPIDEVAASSAITAANKNESIARLLKIDRSFVKKLMDNAID